MLIHWDAGRDVMKAGSHEQTLKAGADHFVKIYQESLSQYGSFSVALSGGSTPKALFSLLTKEPYVSLFDWSKVFLFWSDERAVAPDDPDSNYHMAMQAGFSDVPLPKSHIHRMVAEEDIEQNAIKYETLIKSHLKGRGFDLVMLGMGEDGHTASLFPGTEGLKAKEKLVIANYVPQKNSWRMTLTFECINQSRHIVIYVLGKSKQEMVKKSLSSKGLYPIENIGTKAHKALWILDDEAAFLLGR